MERCYICNFTCKEGSDLLDTFNPDIKIKYHLEDSSFICSVCEKAILENLKELKKDDLEEGEIEYEIIN